MSSTLMISVSGMRGHVGTDLTPELVARHAAHHPPHRDISTATHAVFPSTAPSRAAPTRLASARARVTGPGNDEGPRSRAFEVS